MKKKILEIGASLLLLAISVVLLCIFVPTNKGSDDGTVPEIESISCLAEDIELNIDEIKYNFYTVSNNQAEISFVVDKPECIEITKDYVKGVKAGVVTVTITAEYKDMTDSATIVVKVYGENYNVSFENVLDCRFDGNILLMDAPACQFKVKIYDKLNNPVENISVSINVVGNATLNSDYGIYFLSATESCQLIIEIEELDFSKTIEVVI